MRSRICPEGIRIVRRRGLTPTVDSSGVYDLTSKGPEPWVRFSPFYPHGNIPVPHWPDMTAASVEGIWQGLKRFEHEDKVDTEAFRNRSMRRIKRTSRGLGQRQIPRGKVLGHQLGKDTETLLDYRTARMAIYLPAYRWVLDHCLQSEIASLREAARRHSVILLDYETNCDISDTSRPLAHCGLVKLYLLEAWPEREVQAAVSRLPHVARD